MANQDAELGGAFYRIQQALSVMFGMGGVVPISQQAALPH